MKYLGFPRRGSWSKAVLLNVVWCSIAVAGQIVLSSSTSTASTLNFGSVAVGSSSTISTVVSNSGRSNLTITRATVSGTAFRYSGPSLPVTVAPGQSVSLGATFTPLSAGGAIGRMFVVSARNGRRNWRRPETSTISLAGTGTGAGTPPVSGPTATPGFLGTSPSSLSFGSIQLPGSQVLNETVTNSGGSSVTISQATVTGAGFSLGSVTLPQTLAAKASLTLSISFAPKSAETASGALMLSSNASNANVSVTLSATGTSPGQLSVAPGSISFGNVVVGTSQSQSGTLSASGSSVTVSSATSNSSEFVLSGLTFPLNIPAGQSVPFTIKFSPQISGTASASISFLGSAASATETMTGTGAAPTQHSADLSWSPSPSTVVGYNVYRGTTSGGPYAKVNSSLDPSTLYTDSTVQNGKTYYYVSTAVNSAGTESGFSNQLQMVIPAQ
jgi:Abnormal spindle-like microcephaly-assoc'd, ASPM-SPD-2-Hydin